MRPILREGGKGDPIRERSNNFLFPLSPYPSAAAARERFRAPPAFVVARLLDRRVRFLTKPQHPIVAIGPGA